jgi:hypothetical protein
VKSFGRDRLIVSNGKTGKCHFVAVGSSVGRRSRRAPMVCGINFGAKKKLKGHHLDIRRN